MIASNTAHLLRFTAFVGLLLSASLTAKDFNVRDFGASGNGKSLDHGAMQQAIDAAAKAGGGRVVFPPGTYLSGSIALKSGVTLHLEKGATILGSTDLKLYRRLNFLALITAHHQHNIGITGEGVIDGQGKPIADAVIGPIKPGKYPDAGEAKRPVILNFLHCRDITIRGITLTQSACWVQYYRDCEKLLIENIKVRTLAAITNDGLDIDGCRDVIVRNCDIDSEDDALCLKSSRRMCENILIENCRLRSSCNALKFGTASFKGFRNITVRNLEIHDTYLSGITIQSVDGGVIDNIRISGVRMKTTNNPIFIRLGNRNEKAPPGKVSNIVIEDVVAEIPNRPRSEMNKFPPYWRHLCTTLITGSITGLPGHPVRGVTLKNIHITYGGIGTEAKADHHRIDRLDDIPECRENYPESKMFGVLPAWGLYCRHAADITFENVTLAVSGQDYRAALVCDKVTKLFLDRLIVKSAGSEPVIVLKDVEGIRARDCSAPANAAKLFHSSGTSTEIQHE